MDEYLSYANHVVKEESGKKRPDGMGCSYRSALAQGMVQVLKDMQHKKEAGVKTIPGPEPVKLNASVLVTKWTEPPIEDMTMIHLAHPTMPGAIACGTENDDCNVSEFFDEVTCLDCLYECVAMGKIATRCLESKVVGLEANIQEFEDRPPARPLTGDSLEDMLDLLEDLAYQSCIAAVTDKGVTFDSMAISAYRDLLLTLAKHGRVYIESQSGRRVIATLVLR